MGFAEFAKIRCAGPAIALSLAVALLAALTLTPALLRLFGRAAFWPQARMREQQNDKAWRPLSNSLALSSTHPPARTPFWEWISQGVVSRPVLVWSFAVLTLAPLAVLG